MSVAGLLPQTPSAVVLLGAALLPFGLYLLTPTLTQRREPPGPRPLPLIGNLLQLDLHRPYHSLCELSKKYGSVFTVHFGPKKAVVLAGYKTVKEALVNHATEFGNRDISPALRDLYKEHEQQYEVKGTDLDLRRGDPKVTVPRGEARRFGRRGIGQQ